MATNPPAFAPLEEHGGNVSLPVPEADPEAQPLPTPVADADAAALPIGAEAVNEAQTLDALAAADSVPPPALLSNSTTLEDGDGGNPLIPIAEIAPVRTRPSRAGVATPPTADYAPLRTRPSRAGVATPSAADQPPLRTRPIRASRTSSPAPSAVVPAPLRSRLSRPPLTIAPATNITMAVAKPLPPWRTLIYWLTDHRGFWLALLAIACAFLGQRIYSSFNGATQDSYGDAPKYYLIACSLLVIAFLYTYRTHRFFRSGDYPNPAGEPPLPKSNDFIAALVAAWRSPGASRLRRIPWWRFALLAASLLTAALGVLRWKNVNPSSANPNDLPAILYWLLSIIFIVLATLGQRFDVWPLHAENPDEYPTSAVDEDGRRGDGGWAFANHRLEVALIALIMLVAALARLVDLGTIPTGIHGDEAELGLLARDVVQGNFQSLPLLGAGPWYNVPSMVAYLSAPGMALFGDTTAYGLRFTTAVFGILTVFFMYLLLRLLFKGRTALIGTALLALSDVHIQFSHLSLGTEQIGTCLTASFYFFYKGLRTKRYSDFVWSGLAAGFGLYSYPSSRIIAVLLVLLVAYLVLTRLTFLRDYWSHLAISALAALIIAAPLLFFTIENTNIFNERMRDVYITYGGAATQTFQRWGIPLPSQPPYSGNSPLDLAAFQNIIQNWNNGWSKMIWQQTRAAFLSLNAVHDQIYFYETGKPLLNPELAVLTILGLAYFLWRWRDPRYMLFNIWFWPAMFLAVAMTINAPDVLRMAGLTQAWVAFPAVLLNKIAYEAEKTGWFVRPELRAWMRQRRYSLRQLLTLNPSPKLVAANSVPVSSINNMLRTEVGNVAGYHPPTPTSYSPSRLPVRLVKPPRTGPAYLNLILAAVVVALGFENLEIYFDNYGMGNHFIGITTPARYIQQLGSDYYIYYMGMHQYYYNHSDIRYLAPNQPGDDFWNPPDLLPIHDDHGKQAAFLIFPYHADFLPLIEQYYPEGQSYAIHSPADGGLVFTNYVVPLNVVRASAALSATYYTDMNLNSAQPSGEEASSVAMSLTNAPRHPPGQLSYPASVRWEGSLYAPSYGGYDLELSSQDDAGKGAAVALYLDGQPWLSLSSSATTTSTRLIFAQGWHHISLRAALPDPSQRVSLRWKPPAGRLTDIPSSDFFNGPLSDRQYGLTGAFSSAGQSVTQRRVDPFIGFMNTADLFHTTTPFDVTWSGNLMVPTTDSYSFSITTLGPVTLQIDGQTVLSGGPSSGSEQAVSGTALPLSAGAHQIQLSYHWQQDYGSLKLYWTSSAGQELIPPSALQPAASIWNPQELPDQSMTIAPANLASNPSSITPVMVLPASGSNAPFVQPQGIGVDAAGNIYVGEAEPPHVYKYDPSGKLVADWAVLQPVSGEAKSSLIDLAVDPQGEVYVLDPASKNLEVYDSQGKLVGHRNSNNKFAAYGPSGLALDREGNIYIANTGGSDILKVSADDRLVHDISGEQDYPAVNGAADPHRSYQPIDLSIGEDGSIYTVDLNQRIIEYNAAGKYVTEWKIPGIGGGSGSMHMASYGHYVYLSDNAAEGVYIVDTTDGSISLVGGGGSGPGQFNNPAGLATDGGGRLYVADRNNGRVQIFAPPLP